MEYAAPAHHRMPAALALVDRAAKGELVLHLPAICIRDGEDAIRKRFQPKVDELRQFRRWAEGQKILSADESKAANDFLQRYQSTIVSFGAESSSARREG